MLVRILSMGNIHQFLVGMKTFTAIVASNETFPQEESICRSSNKILGQMPQLCCILLERHLLNYVHCCSIHNSQSLEINLIVPEQ